MGRSPCCSSSSSTGEGLNRGAWTAQEDKILSDYIKNHGEGRWRKLPEEAGLRRCGKSCRLRWLNYLRPDIKRGNISPEEEELIVRLHKLLGNRWSLIAGRLPGRTDNEIKNYWNTILGKKQRQAPVRAATDGKKTQTPLAADSWVASPKDNNAAAQPVVRTKAKALECSSQVFIDNPKRPAGMASLETPPDHQASSITRDRMDPAQGDDDGRLLSMTAATNNGESNDISSADPLFDFQFEDTFLSDLLILPGLSAIPAFSSDIHQPEMGMQM
ncbi:hypothetical protein SAY86_009329 [Trapa natans]|uniref:Uncharacterized protein n=1 Tax=Trapa natans TaxID=22666 RepID=A0AAN7QPQ9_TRANT|nr:hypothetical protein SAY86_009329 [Trapa natans]